MITIAAFFNRPDHLETRQRPSRRGEDDRDVRCVPPRVIDQVLDQRSRMVGIALCRVAETLRLSRRCAERAGQLSPGEFAQVRAGQHVGTFDEHNNADDQAHRRLSGAQHRPS
jgi:hypothetical protein